MSAIVRFRLLLKSIHLHSSRIIDDAIRRQQATDEKANAASADKNLSINSLSTKAEYLDEKSFRTDSCGVAREILKVLQVFKGKPKGRNKAE
jgi:hypothetical protein